MVVLLLAACHGSSTSAGPNVVLVVADTLRRDRMSAYGAARETTPHFDARMDHVVRWDDVFATSNWTFPTTASILTGAVPERHGIDFDPQYSESDADPYPLAIPSLVPAIHDAGFRTGLVSGNIGLSWIEGLEEGFDLYEVAPQTSTGNSDDVVSAALDWIDDGQGRFFLHLQPMDMHFPYVPAPDVDGVFCVDEEMPFDVGDDGEQAAIDDYAADDPAGQAITLDGLLDLYDEELLYLDQQIDRLIVGLEERGLADDTFVVWTADHGELFDDGGSGLFGHGVSLRPGVNRVPFLVYNPGLRAGTDDRLMSGVDVLPTMLANVGLELEAPDGLALDSTPRASAYAWDATGATHAPADPPMAALTDGRWKVWHDCHGAEAAFDLDADPDEAAPFDPATHAETAALAADLRERIALLHPSDCQ
jgi:arylsulfatase